MTPLERKDKILRNFRTIGDFMDILRKVEENNYFIIQETQEIEKDLNDEEYKLSKLKAKAEQQINAVDNTLKKLEQDKKALTEKLIAKRKFLNSNE
jgi:flagellar motility protein MotE (MotC chaperone)